MFFGPGRESFSHSILAVHDILLCFISGSCQGLHYDSTYFNTMTNNPLLITSTWFTNVILLLLLGIFKIFLDSETYAILRIHWLIDWLIDTNTLNMLIRGLLLINFNCQLTKFQSIKETEYVAMSIISKLLWL